MEDGSAGWALAGKVGDGVVEGGVAEALGGPVPACVPSVLRAYSRGAPTAFALGVISDVMVTVSVYTVLPQVATENTTLVFEEVIGCKDRQ